MTYHDIDCYREIRDVSMHSLVQFHVKLEGHETFEAYEVMNGAAVPRLFPVAKDVRKLFSSSDNRTKQVSFLINRLIEFNGAVLEKPIVRQSREHSVRLYCSSFITRKIKRPWSNLRLKIRPCKRKFATLYEAWLSLCSYGMYVVVTLSTLLL